MAGGVLALVVLGGALALRLARLDARPMHTDEAVQAVKFAQLLEGGGYRYDPREFHGPTLYYFTLPAAWLRGQRHLAALDETTVRLAPAVLGAGCVVLVVLLADGLGRAAAGWAAALLACSPALVFYSRYYIHETLLTFFTLLALGAGWRQARTGRWRWALLAGGAAGLMHATKETCIIAYGCGLAALAATLLWRRAAGPSRWAVRVRPGPIGTALLAAAGVSMLLFSSFGTNVQGMTDSLRTYGNYFQRAGGGLHEQPWHYYLGLLLYHREGGGPIWSEGLIVALAAVGTGAALAGRGLGQTSEWLARFWAVYTLLMTSAYSAIPYKTPWSMLSALQGLVVLAGVGAGGLVRAAPRRAARALVGVLLAAGVAHLGWQAYRGSFRYAADERNPYVYGHTTADTVRLGRRAEQIAAVAPEGRRLLITVVAKPDDYWPLPWYLRRFWRVGYWTEAPAGLGGALVIASRGLAEQVEARLPGPYQMEYFGLRPGVLLSVYVRRDLWDAFLAGRGGRSSAPAGGSGHD